MSQILKAVKDMKQNSVKMSEAINKNKFLVSFLTKDFEKMWLFFKQLKMQAVPNNNWENYYFYDFKIRGNYVKIYSHENAFDGQRTITIPFKVIDQGTISIQNFLTLKVQKDLDESSVRQDREDSEDKEKLLANELKEIEELVNLCGKHPVIAQLILSLTASISSMGASSDNFFSE